eukprot:2556530-Pyramimonas_sp.AAC.1
MSTDASTEDFKQAAAAFIAEDRCCLEPKLARKMRNLWSTSQDIFSLRLIPRPRGACGAHKWMAASLGHGDNSCTPWKRLAVVGARSC